MPGAAYPALGPADAVSFTEINRLAALKTKDGRDGIEAAAKQFESLFIDLVLKGMREANRAFSEGNYTTSSEMELHQEMLDHDGSFVLEVIVPYTEHVLPMIPAGKTVKEMILK